MDCPKCGFAMSELEVECPRCKKMAETSAKEPAPPSPPAPAVPAPRQISPEPPKNQSGTDMPPPLEVMDLGWCWGAFGLSWIWGIGNHVWISLLAFIPYLGLPVAIWLGLAGHQLAWKKRRFYNLEQYRQTMRVWNGWGLGIFIANTLFSFALVALVVMFPVFGNSSLEKARQESCLSNEKQISIGMLAYAQDYDGVMPMSSGWQDGIMPYIKNEEVLICPSDGTYGYNKNLSMFSLWDVKEPSATGALYEVDYSGEHSYPHNAGMNVGFTDGHCKWYTKDGVKQIIW